jgi:hypothetical protein
LFLTSVSGRSYNDISQYPVFPWILNDYSSPELDLSDLSVYRDLTKPIGALSSKRLDHVMERMDSFEASDPHKFHYGSHYSSGGVVLHYLLRMEPFASLHVELQGMRERLI